MLHRVALLAALLLSTAALAGAPASANGCPRPASCPAVGKAAPPFGLPLARAGRTSLRELLARKRPVVLDFWRHDCAPCLADLPKLEALAAEWGERVSVQLVHVGGPEEEMQARLEKWGATLSCAFDANECTGVRWCVASFPQLWVLDASGKLVAHLQGEPRDFAAAVRAAVAPLLDGK